MFSKLLKLFGKQPEVQNNVQPAEIIPEITTSNTENSNDFSGPSSLIGYNYIKRKGEDEDNLKPRRFINLNELLRGGYKDERKSTSQAPDE